MHCVDRSPIVELWIIYIGAHISMWKGDPLRARFSSMQQHGYLHSILQRFINQRPTQALIQWAPPSARKGGRGAGDMLFPFDPPRVGPTWSHQAFGPQDLSYSTFAAKLINKYARPWGHRRGLRKRRSYTPCRSFGGTWGSLLGSHRRSCTSAQQ